MIQTVIRWLNRTVQGAADRTQVFLGRLNPYTPEELNKMDDMTPVKVEESVVKRQGFKVILAVFIGLLIWASTAPLDEGIVVGGSIVVLNNRKAVQHHAGGIVEEILVVEGDHVEQGQVLLKVNPLSVDAELVQTEYGLINTLATYSRLLAERTGSTRITWDSDLDIFAGYPQVEEAKRLQLTLFISRVSQITAQRTIMAEKQKGIEEQLRQKQQVLKLKGSLIDTINKDAENLRRLAGDGFVPRLRANEAERSSIDAIAGVTGLEADVSSLQTSLASHKLEFLKLNVDYEKDLDAQITDAQKTKETLKARVKSLRFDRQQTSIRAPVSGVIVGVKTHTVGGVISGGSVLMEVVPDEQQLVAEVAVQPEDIDKMQVGLPCDMRFTAFNVISTPVIPGKVKLVGADRLPPAPPRVTSEYYLARVEPLPGALEKYLPPELQVVAGMPVEVIVKSGERTFMGYLIKPLKDRFARAFKE